MVKIDIKSINGKILFSHEEYGNSVKKTIKEAVLRGTNLINADLSGNDISGTFINGANLRGADIRGANLRGADISGADISGADFRCANLRDADISGADLRGADLRGANLRGADLRGANIRGANLSGADISGANFSYSDLSQSKGINYSQCSFSGHGEINRVLTAVEIDGEIQLFCGCFLGNEEKFREYIEKGEYKFKESRILALETVLKLLNYSIKNK